MAVTLADSSSSRRKDWPLALLAALLGHACAAAALLHSGVFAAPAPALHSGSETVTVALIAAPAAAAAAPAAPTPEPAQVAQAEPKPVPKPAPKPPVQKPKPAPKPVAQATPKPAPKPAPKPVAQAAPQTASETIPAPATPAAGQPQGGRGPLGGQRMTDAQSAAGMSVGAVHVTAAHYHADYLHNPPAPYPALSRRLGEEGTVRLRVRVGADGRALMVRLAESSGFARLDDSARETVAQWRFVPARRGQETMESEIIVPIIFRLKGNSPT